MIDQTILARLAQPLNEGFYTSRGCISINGELLKDAVTQMDKLIQINTNLKTINAELLGALRECVKTLNYVGYDEPAIDTARSAIAKATGET